MVGRDPTFAQQQERMRAHVILRFHEKADSLLVSGLLVGGDELAGKAAVVDACQGSDNGYPTAKLTHYQLLDGPPVGSAVTCVG